jgi:hypothetical protein
LYQAHREEIYALAMQLALGKNPSVKTTEEVKATAFEELEPLVDTVEILVHYVTNVSQLEGMRVI